MQTDIQTKAQIMAALRESFDDFSKTIQQWPEASFEENPAGKWSVGQQLDHLIRSVKPVNLAMRLPKWLLRIAFGKPNRPSRTYEALVEKYLQKLGAGGKAPATFVPPTIALSQKEHLLGVYEKQKQKLLESANRWTEADLERYLLPHPLLGKLSLKEMLFFTIYHTGHHHRQVLQNGNLPKA